LAEGKLQVKNLRVHLIGILFAASACTRAWGGPDLTNYELTFVEDFQALSISNSTVHDGARWYTQTKACCMQDSTGKAAYLYTGQNGVSSPFSLIQSGGLNIRLSRQNNAWISGLIASVDSSGNGFSQQYGYFEMKAKFPAKAPGTWPAFWMMPKPDVVGGEIDIVEAYGHDTSGIVITLHDWVHDNIPAQFYAHVGDITDAYHTYGLLWTEQTMTFYFDGTQVFQTRTPEVMKQPYYLLVDLGVGGGWPTDRTPNPSDMQVQYVKAYRYVTPSSRSGLNKD
jgi:hypothetical protein